MERGKINLKFWKFSPKKDFHGSLEVSGSLAKLPRILEVFENFQNIQKLPNALLERFSRCIKNFQLNFLTRARLGVRVFTWKNISPKGDIYFSKVNSLEVFENFQFLAKNYDASPLPLSGRLAVILPQNLIQLQKEAQ